MIIFVLDEKEQIMPQLSTFIITPFNKLSTNFERTYTGIINQDFKSWHWILVDDCTEHDETTIHWLDKLNKEKRVSILENIQLHGAGNARNCALDYIRLEYQSAYIFFCDAGDEWENSFLSKMLKGMREKNVNIISSSYKMSWSNGKTKDIRRSGLRDYNQMLRDYSTSCSFTGVFMEDTCWFETIRFGEHKRVNDQPFFFAAVSKLGSVYHLDDCLGTYFVGDKTSLSGKKSLTAIGKWRLLKSLNLSNAECVYYFLHYAFRGIKRYIL